MVCTPTVVCTIIGNTDAMKIRKMGEALPTPNQRMAIGIQAMGEMGRMIWNSGFSVTNAPCTQPIQRPSGMARATAIPKPAPTRISDAPMCSHRVPSRASSNVPVTTCHGVGKIALSVATTAAHQIAKTTAITAIEGTACLRPFIYCLPSLKPVVPAPANLLPGPYRLRFDDHQHLPARVRAAFEAILRLHFERKPEALSWHEDGGTELLWHVVEIPQVQHVVHAQRQRDLRGQDVDAVAGHAPRERTFRDLAELVARG